MRRRFWRAVFRYAAPRTGWERYAKDRDERMDDAYAGWGKVTWTQPTSVITSTIRGANITWRNQ